MANCALLFEDGFVSVDVVAEESARDVLDWLETIRMKPVDIFSIVITRHIRVMPEDWRW